MTDGIHALTAMAGDPRFHKHKGIDGSVAEMWRNDANSLILCKHTWEIAEEPGYHRKQNKLLMQSL